MMDPRCWICQRRLDGGRIRFVTIFPQKLARPVHRSCAAKLALVVVSYRRLERKWSRLTSSGKSRKGEPRHRRRPIFSGGSRPAVDS